MALRWLSHQPKRAKPRRPRISGRRIRDQAASASQPVSAPLGKDGQGGGDRGEDSQASQQEVLAGPDDGAPAPGGQGLVGGISVGHGGTSALRAMAGFALENGIGSRF